MDTKKLHQKILDLAIRGKLVPQDPNDEPASVLLERIKAEKERLIKEGKIKRNKKENTSDKSPYRKVGSITNYELKITEGEVPFEVPESWAWCRLGVIAFLKAGFFVKAENIKSECQEELFPCYGGNGLRGYVETFTHEGFYSLIGRQGALCGNINLVNGKFHATEHAIVTTLHCDINSLWAFYTLKALNLNQYSIGAAQPGLSVERINKVFIPLPPLEEQQRIVSVIESAFALIDEIENNKLSLEQFIKQAKSKVLDLAIHGKLVSQDPNDEPASALLEKIKKEQKTAKIASDISHYPFEVPDSWVWTRLNEIASVSLGKTLDKGKNKGLFRTYLRSVNVRWSNIDLDDLKEMKFEDSEIERYSISYGDLLICEGGEAGRCAVWKYEDITMRYQNAIHRVRFNTKIVPDFYMYSLWNYHNSNILSEYCKGVTIKHLTGQSLALLYFPLPPLAEQKRIVSKIEEIFVQLDEIGKALKA